MFLAVSLAALGMWQWGESKNVLPVVLGVIAGGLVDQDHRLTGRLTNLLFTLLAFSLSSLAVQIGLGWGYGFVLVMGALTFGFTMLGAAGSRYRTVAFGTLAVATYTSLTTHGGEHWGQNSLLILLGTLIYSLTSLLVYAALPHRQAQQQLARAFRALAHYIEHKALFFDPDQQGRGQQLQIDLALQNSAVIARFNECRQTLHYHLTRRSPRAQARTLAQLYFVAQDVHERVSSAHFDYDQLARRWQRADLLFRIERLMRQQASFCREIAAYLEKGDPLTEDAAALQRSAAHLAQAWQWHGAQQLTPQAPEITRLLENLQAINRELLAALGDDEPEVSYGIVATEDESFGAAFASLRQNFGLHSATFRHAVRLTVVVSLSCLIALVLKLPLGYWIMLTGLFVCQPSYTATRTKSTQRVVGTVAGAFVGSVLPQLVPSFEGKLTIIVLTTTLFFALRSVRYSFSTFFITVEALTALSLTGRDVSGVLVPRIADTLAGSALAWLAVRLMWPDWRWLDVGGNAQRALEAIGRYLGAIAEQLQQGRRDDMSYRLIRRQAYEHAAALGQEVNEAALAAREHHAQPEQDAQLLALTYGLLGTVAALGAARPQDTPTLDSATRQFLNDTAGLMTRLPDLPTTQRHAELGSLRQRLDEDPRAIGRPHLKLMLKLLQSFADTLETGSTK